MYKLHVDQIQDYWNMKKDKIVRVDHEHFVEQPLIVRAGETHHLVVVDDNKNECSHVETVFILEVNEYQTEMELVHPGFYLTDTWAMDDGEDNW